MVLGKPCHRLVWADKLDEHEQEAYYLDNPSGTVVTCNVGITGNTKEVQFEFLQLRKRLGQERKLAQSQNLDVNTEILQGTKR